jgi:hypothetical protein
MLAGEMERGGDHVGLVRFHSLSSCSGVDRLDRALTIAQMQGKFQLQVFPMSGHCIHEDQPDDVASQIAQYLLRFRLCERAAAAEYVFVADRGEGLVSQGHL